MNFKILGLIALLLIVFFFQTNTDKLTRSSSTSAWEDWKNKYNKEYESKEIDFYRELVFQKNVDYIKQLNARNDGVVYAVNKFTDMTQEQWAQTYLQKDRPLREKKQTKYTSSNQAIDWRTKGAVTAVKDQGSCGSCWSFSATGNLEGTNQIFGSGVLTSFSEQQLMDCSWDYGNHGCLGGLEYNAFAWTVDHGITTEADYPYQGQTSFNCQKDEGDYHITGYIRLDAGNCDTLQQSILTQPTSIGVDATNWQYYYSGIFSNCKDDLNHSVLAVGFNSDQYWIVKNSWSDMWGENGYIRLKMGNTCGICDDPSTSQNKQ